jgi:hypothetical protein
VAQLFSLGIVRAMKTFIWLSTAAFGLVCFTCWIMTKWSLFWLANSDHPSTAHQIAIEHYYGCILGLPIPWVIWSAILAFRRQEITTSALFTFAGTLILAVAIVVCVVVLDVVPKLYPLFY